MLFSALSPKTREKLTGFLAKYDTAIMAPLITTLHLGGKLLNHTVEQLTQPPKDQNINE